MGRIQKWTGTTGGTFPTSLTTSASGSPTTAGSTIVVALLADGLASTQLFTMTDSVGNSYTRLGTVNINSTGQLDVWAAGNNIGGASHTVTAGNLGSTTAALIVEEWTQLGRLRDALALASDATSTSTTVSVGPTKLPVYSNQAVFFAHSASTATAGFATASGYSNLNQLNSNPSTLGLQSKVIGDPATQSGTTSFSPAADWLGIVVSIPFYYGGTTTSTSSTSASTFSTSSTSSSISTSSTSFSSTSSSISTTSSSTSYSITTISTSSTSSSISSTSSSSTSSSTSISSTSSSISSTSFSSTSISSTSSSTSFSSTSTSFSSTSSSVSSTSHSTSSTSFSSTSSSSSTSTTAVPSNLIYTYQDSAPFTRVSQFTTTSTWVCPANVTAVTAECWGGGGGGGGNSSTQVGGGGGGGQYARKNSVAVTPGTSYTVTVGAGGVTGTSATAGGDSWFSTSGTVLAKGGGAGASSGSGTAAGGSGSLAGSIGDVLFNGGSGGNGDFAGAVGGGGGGAGGSVAAGANGGAGGGGAGGTGGARAAGGGAGAVGAGASAAGNATPFGGGGGGGASVTFGGTAGVPGGVILTYTAIGLPTGSTNDIDSDTAKNYQNVAVDDGDYFIQYGSDYMIQEYKKQWTNNTDVPSFVWRGRSTKPTTSYPMYLQIYNQNSAAWETLDNETLQPADTDFTLNGSQATNVSNYYDANNVVTFRIYQQVN